MKSKKMIILCALLGISFAAVGTVSYIHSEVDTPKKAEASETVNEDYVFLKPNSNWIKDGARFAVNYFNETVNEWADMFNNEINGYQDKSIYYAKVPTGMTYIFCRMNPSTTENNWANKWNQTNNITTIDFNSKNLVEQKEYWDYGTDTINTCMKIPSASSRDIYVKSTSVASPNVYAFTSNVTYYGLGKENSAFPGVATTKVEGLDHVYTVSINESFKEIIFTDGKTEYTQKTANIPLIAKEASSTNGNIQGYTLNSDWSYSYGLISESPMTTSNFVLYLHRNYHYSDGYSYSFHYWNDEGTINHEIFPNYVKLNHTEWHAKFVISSEAIGCNSQFKVYSSSGSFQTNSATIKYESTFNNGEAQVSFPNDVCTISYSQKSSNQSDAATAAKILSNYYSCLNNDYNGFAQIDNLCTNWGFSSATADIDTIMMDDYATTDDYGTTNKTSSITVGAKIAEMKRMSEIAKANSVNISNMVFGNDNTNAIALITIASLIALVSLAVIILRKRHLSNNN